MALARREAPKTFDLFDRVFGRYPDLFHRPIMLWPETLDDTLRVEEFRENGSLVIRADIPGIDPKEDVEVTLTDGILRITAERKQEETTDKKNFFRHELRYGTFTRELPMPEGASEEDVKAVYKDGVLEVRVPVAEPAPSASPRKISVATS
jgi:HSP20 family protein